MGLPKVFINEARDAPMRMLGEIRQDLDVTDREMT